MKVSTMTEFPILQPALGDMPMSRQQHRHQPEYPGFVAQIPAPLPPDSAVSKVDSWKSPFQDIRKSGLECDIYLIRSAQYSGRRRA